MVAGDIGEGTRREPDPVDAALLEPMARGFERKVGDAFIG